MAKKKTQNIMEGNEAKKLIQILAVVVVIFIIFYVITLIVNKKEKIEGPKATIQYDEILIGNMLNRNNTEYYVMIYALDDDYNILYDAYISTYKNKENSIRFYTANLDNPLNSRYVFKEGQIVSPTADEILIKESTLFKIKDGKIEKSYSGFEEISTYLKKLSEA